MRKSVTNLSSKYTVSQTNALSPSKKNTQTTTIYTNAWKFIGKSKHSSKYVCIYMYVCVSYY